MTPTLSPQDFVARWRHATLRERSAAQSHFNDLCVLLGQPTPAEADPAGRWYTFEVGASEIDHRRAVALLKAAGYDGYLSGEWSDWEPYEIHLPRELATMRAYEL